ncbi:polysaccharide deacetylase family protein [Cohnella candidum]|uniref:Polysaccharide deacetylase family protein n=1 Tax=Cohnella candidum TaxID=2674991 RepID=A0A3G3K346_9BACL|nr:polysaccharide deacetylase family protein [Cohnella candidum]AYQ74862.1 polysaccharide deacetylase family protein [Cohnella candidum]
MQRKRASRLTAAALALALAVLASSALKADAAPRHDRTYYESRGDVVWEVPGNEKVLALTFDDGPDPQNTPAILDLLKQYHARATFFTIGRKVRENPELAKRQVSEGHELANHTYTHRFLGPSSTQERIREEVSKTQKIIFETTGQTSRLFRPPGGVFTDVVLAEVKKERLQTVMWSWHQDTKDWARPGVGRIVRKVLRNARNGDIVLLHDYVNGSTQTVDALKIILPELQKLGYRFVTVSELMGHSKAVW